MRPRLSFLLVAALAIAPPLHAQGTAPDTTTAKRLVAKAKQLQDSIAKRSTSPTIDNQAGRSKVLIDSAYLVLAPKPVPPPVVIPPPPPSAVRTAKVDIRGLVPMTVGQTLQLQGIPRDANNNTLTTAVAWSATPATVADISGTGLVTAKGVGTAQITAKADTASRTLSLTVSAPVVVDTSPPVVVIPPVVVPPVGVIFSHPFGAPANGTQLATLPQDTVDASYPAITRRYACSNLQTCLDTAQTGDEILLTPGASFSNVTVKPTSRAGWVVVRTNVSDAQLGGPWERMTPSKAAALNLATIRSPGTSTPAILVASSAHHVRFVGVRVKPAAFMTNALIRVGLAEATVAALPHHVTLDRIVVDGDTNDVRRCVAFDGDYLALLSSTLANCHSSPANGGGDSQGVLKIHGRGPIRIENNAIAAGHQSVFLGGGDPSIRGIVPADVVIRRNDLSRPLAWKGVWQVKTNVELKIGKRVLIEGNVICHTWHDAQAGYAILVKTENQDGGTWGDWSETSDVTIRDNQICGAAAGINLAALPAGPGIPLARVSIYGNVADSVGMGVYAYDTGEALLNQGVSDVVYRDNWTRNSGRACLYLSGTSQRFAASGNICGGSYGIYGEGGGPSVAAPGSLITGNTVLAPGTAFTAWPAIPADSTRAALLNGVAP